MWSAQVGLGSYENGNGTTVYRDYDDVYILETAVYPSQEEETNNDLEFYQVPLQPYTFSDADAEYEEPAAPDYDDGEVYQYTTHYHRYEATYSKPFPLAGEWVFTVTNRRLGNVDLTVTKTWDDGDGTLRSALAAAIEELGEGESIAPYVRLKFAEGTPEEYTISGTQQPTEDGGDTVKVGGTAVPIENNEEGSTTALQEISLKADSRKQVFYFFNLPKYDEGGTVVRYDAEEVWLAKDSNGVITEVLNNADALSNYFKENLTDYAELDELLELLSAYQSTTTQDTYAPALEGEALTNDTQDISIHNSLGNTKTIYWHKDWRDNYNLESGQRPDIYLDIYRKSDAPNATVKLYQADYRWQYNGTLEQIPGLSEDETDPQYHWHAIISGVQKYDSDGYEYTYYAVGARQCGHVGLDYASVGYSVPGEDGNLTEIGTASEVDDEYIGEGYVVDIGQLSRRRDTGEFALIEGGTFTNQLSSTITIQGRKLWNGLPNGYDMADLPTVTFTLYRSVNGGTKEPAATLTVGNWVSAYQNGSYQFVIDKGDRPRAPPPLRRKWQPLYLCAGGDENHMAGGSCRQRRDCP